MEPPAWPDGVERVAERHRQLAEIEWEIDEEVYRLYGISESDRRAIEAELAARPAADDDAEPEDEPSEEAEAPPAAWTRTRLAQAWLSWAVGRVLEAEAFCEAGRPLAEAVWRVLEGRHGEAAAEVIVTEACGPGPVLDRLADDLALPFFKRPLSQYRKRPIYWLLLSGRKNFGVWLFARRYDQDTLFKVLHKVVEPRCRWEEKRLAELRARFAAWQASHAGSASAGSTTTLPPRESRSRLPREAKRLAQDIENQLERLEELRDFQQKLRRVAELRLVPDINDGVALNLAPLWELVPFPDAKKYWQQLLQGHYSWSSLSRQLHRGLSA
ncbi:MAG: hypothetical protein RMI91_00270 [Gemmatales bacterium]|nr:BREX-1 system adenine-specific DNA-methyltransferase PglX [Gemmatales bacterium]MDW7993065.1 hypothetical protein [Gemmatales bacterium]